MPKTWLLNLRSEIKKQVYSNKLVGFLLRPLILVDRKIQIKLLKPKNEVCQLLSNILVNDPVLHVKEFNGDFLIDKRSTLLSRILVKGSYEPKLAKLALQYTDTSKDVIDIGSNIGFYSVLLAKHIDKTRKVLSIEPTLNALEKLRKNLELNEISDKVIIYDGVISNESGEVEINTILGKEEYSSVNLIVHSAVATSSYVAYKVKCTTLDTIVDLHNLNPGFVKIDVEGAEHLVLDGARNTLSRYRPIILTEVSEKLLSSGNFSVEKMLNLIKSYGYDIFDPSFSQEMINPHLCKQIICIPSNTNK